MVSLWFLHCALRILGSPECQISNFFNVGHFEPDITDFVKNLWREMEPSNIWILGSEHGLEHGHSRTSMSKHRLSTSKHKQARASTSKFWMRVFAENLVNIASLHAFCPKHCKYCCFCMFFLQKPLWILLCWNAFCRKPQKYCCFCTLFTENLVNIAVFEHFLEKTL